MGADHPCLFSAADCFQPIMGVELVQDMLDMIVDRHEIQAQVIGNRPAFHSIGEQAQDFKLTMAQYCLSRDGRLCLEDGFYGLGRQTGARYHKIVEQLFQPLPRVYLADDVNRKRRHAIVDRCDDGADVAPPFPLRGWHEDIEVFQRVLVLNCLPNKAIL